MSVKPILFSGPMVKALLEGRKTQTRRVIKPQPDTSKISPPFHPEHRAGRAWVFMARDDIPGYSYATADFRTPYAPGDVLYVREALNLGSDGDAPRYMTKTGEGSLAERSDFLAMSVPEAWSYSRQMVPGIHMPRWASRITLPVTNVRVERLQDISPEDAKAEGDHERSGMPEFHLHGPQCHVNWFRDLWDSLNGKRSGFSWSDNPWVSVTEWKEIHVQNVDEFLKERAA